MHEEKKLQSYYAGHYITFTAVKKTPVVQGYFKWVGLAGPGPSTVYADF